MAKRPRFRTYAELFRAFKDGTLRDYELAVDNSSIFLRWIGDVPTLHPDPDEYWNAMQEECYEWFLGDGPKNDIVAILEAAGIPAEWV